MEVKGLIKDGKRGRSKKEEGALTKTEDRQESLIETFDFARSF